MSLEQAIAENTAAIKELIATMAGAKVSTGTTGEKTKKTESKPESTKPKNSREDLDSVCALYKDKFGVDKVKKLIKEVGGAERKAEIPDSTLDAVVDAAKAALKKAADEEEEV